MAVQTTDQIAQNYAKTLQENVGYGQRELNRRNRMSMPGSDGLARQSRMAAPVDSNVWGARGVSGVRNAGWQDSQHANVPSMDSETKMILGDRVGQYQQNGQTKFGFYGDTDVYDPNALGGLLDKKGYAYARGPEDQDYVNAGLDLASVFGRPIYEKGKYDFTQKGDVDRYMQSLGFGHNLGSTIDLQANSELQNFADNFVKVKDIYSKTPSIQDYLFGLGFKDFTDSQFKDFVPLVDGSKMARSNGRTYATADPNAFGYSNVIDPNQYLTSVWDTLGGNEITTNERGKLVNMGFGSEFGPEPYWQPTYNLWGQTYDSMEQAAGAKSGKLQETLSDPALRGELIAQALTKGRIGVDMPTMPDFQSYNSFGNDQYDPEVAKMQWMAQNPIPTREYFGGDKTANQLNADQLRYVLGSKDLSYGGNSLGTIFNQPYKPKDVTWNEYNQSTSKNLFRKKTTTEWDQGRAGAGLSFDNPEWLQNNARSLGDSMFVAKNALSSMPGAKAEDWYERNNGRDVSRSFTGLGSLANFALNFVPMVGPLLSTAQRGYVNGGIGLADVLSFVGGGLVQNGGLKDLTGLGKVADAAAIGAVTGGLSGAAKDGFGGALKGALSGGLGSAAGTYAGSSLQNALGSNGMNLGDTASNVGSKIGSSVTKGALANLMSGKPVMSDLGLRAATSGIAGLGNLFVPEGSTPEERKEYDRLATNTANTLGSVYKKNNPSKSTRRT